MIARFDIFGIPGAYFLARAAIDVWHFVYFSSIVKSTNAFVWKIRIISSRKLNSVWSWHLVKSFVSSWRNHPALQDSVEILPGSSLLQDWSIFSATGAVEGLPRQFQLANLAVWTAYPCGQVMVPIRNIDKMVSVWDLQQIPSTRFSRKSPNIRHFQKEELGSCTVYTATTF